MSIKTVVFDVGDTLIDETRSWNEWADWLGVPRERFFAVQREVVERGEHHRRVFEVLRPGFDLTVARAEREASGNPDLYTVEDLFPDVLPCFAALRARGVSVGIAGNQPLTAEASLRGMGVAADFIASSARWGIEKPSPAFFGKVVDAAGCRPAEIAYVGDRLDNDILPALAIGMVAVFLERGLWGPIHATWPQATQADIRIKSLLDLPEALMKIDRGNDDAGATSTSRSHRRPTDGRA